MLTLAVIGIGTGIALVAYALLSQAQERAVVRGEVLENGQGRRAGITRSFPRTASDEKQRVGGSRDRDVGEPLPFRPLASTGRRVRASEGRGLEDHPDVIAAWLERVRGILGWAPPYEVLPGERVQPRW